MKQPLVIALPKGRIFAKAERFLQSAGITLDQQAIEDRKLIIGTNVPHLCATIVRNIDTSVYTSLGVADMAVLGQDSIAEEKETKSFYDVLDLGIAQCRLMTAARTDYVRSGRRVRVATKFIYTARRFYASLGIQADFIKLFGSVELAVAIGLADEIVDLVETGKTLQENGLRPMEKILDVSCHLVINSNSFVTKNASVMELINRLESAITC